MQVVYTQNKRILGGKWCLFLEEKRLEQHLPGEREELALPGAGGAEMVSQIVNIKCELAAGI